jgi:hypothetical protein
MLALTVNESQDATEIFPSFNAIGGFHLLNRLVVVRDRPWAGLDVIAR